MGYAGNYRYFTYASWVLSAVSALVALVPFVYIWKILRDVLNAAPDYAQAVNIPHYGWMAVLFAVLSYLIYIAALMCSHLSAFRVATNLRLAVSEHLAVLPLGFAEKFGSGKLRRTISETTGATEAYLAHQLPDKAKAIATIVGMLALLAVFDWRLGLLSLAPVLLAFICMSGMTGKNMQRKMTEYQNALADMSNEAVEYVRGIPVVKTFGQTVFSFKKFKGTIDNYEKWTTSYTLDLRGPMMLYTLAINSVFAFLIVGAFWFSHGTVTPKLLLDVLFYIIITPVITLTMTSLMYMSENNMIVADAIERVDSVLNLSELSTSDNVQHPADGSVELENVSFSYDGSKNAVDNVSLKIADGQTVAFVGPSGGGKTTVSRLAARFWDVGRGSIKVGGMDVSNIDPETLMSLYSIVFQDVTLFDNTVMENIRIGNGEIFIDFVAPDTRINDIQLGIPVSINIENGVAAMALAHLNGVTDEEIKRGMASFRGVDRRFDFKLKNDRIVFLSDYAHHPSEIKQSVLSMRELYKDKKITAIFQPHLYTRTRDFYQDFADSLSLLDEVILVDIYPAREAPIPGVTSKLIYDNLRPGIEKSMCKKEDILNILKDKNIEVLITLGAGDIDNYVPEIKELLEKR